MNWLDECRIAAEALTREKRQEFLDLVWTGITLGEAQERCGISFEAANGIMRDNIRSGHYLNRETE